MVHSAKRIKSSILKRACAMAAIAALGGTAIAVSPASALPPRPGKLPCTIIGADGTAVSFLDGSELEVTITYPDGQKAKVHYRCDDGKWVSVSAINSALHGSVLSNAQLTAVIHSANTRVAVKAPNSSLKVIPTASVRATSGIA
jgi:hypothetical protein